MKRLTAKWILLPFSGVYGFLMDVRNWLFNSHLFDSYSPSVYTISVGNLTVGGTGKTPMIEFLIKRSVFSMGGMAGKTATLSRGYGRQTTGFRIANATDTASTIGDEPLQLYRKFSPEVRVCVGERRADAIQALLKTHPDTKQILLDDAYQHRAVQPQVNILLMDYNRPFYDDYPFPAGRLRERRTGARRADAIVVTKCPNNLFATEQARISAKILPYAQAGTPIFFASLRYDEPVAFATRMVVTNLSRVVLVSGLANARPLEHYVRQTYQMIHHHCFADHHAYSRADFDAIIKSRPPEAAILTTEKDWVKLDGLLTSDERATLPLYYLPVAMQLLPGHEQGFTRFLDQSSLKNR